MAHRLTTLEEPVEQSKLGRVTALLQDDTEFFKQFSVHNESFRKWVTEIASR